MSEGNTNRKSALSTALVMVCTFLSRIMGFIRTALIAAFFGAKGDADVVNLVFSIPNNLRKLLAEGAISSAFIPELSGEIEADPTLSRAKALARRILGLQSTIILPLLAISLLFPESVLILFEGFADPAKKELSIVLFRWMIPYLFFVSVSAIMMAVLNTHFKFFIPAVTPIVFSLAVIGSLSITHGRLGAISIGIGVFIGGLFQIAVQYPLFRTLGYSLLPSFRFREGAFLRLLRRWVPMLLTSSLFYINSWLAVRLATMLPDGSTSALSNAIVFYQLPFGLFSASITTVLYPRMSRCAASGNIDGVVESLGFGYRNLWALLLPSAMIMILLGEPIIAVAFQRGAFTAEDVKRTIRVLTAYSVGMPFVGLFNITQRSLYAIGRVREPFYCALVAVVLDVTFSLLSVFVFHWPVEALAWANSIAFLFGAILQYVVMWRISGFSLRGETLNTFMKVLIATAAGACVIVLSLLFWGTQWWSGGSTWKGFGILAAVAAAAAGVILLLYWWMNIETVSIILKRGGRTNDG